MHVCNLTPSSVSTTSQTNLIQETCKARFLVGTPRLPPVTSPGAPAKCRPKAYPAGWLPCPGLQSPKPQAGLHPHCPLPAPLLAAGPPAAAPPAAVHQLPQGSKTAARAFPASAPALAGAAAAAPGAPLPASFVALRAPAPRGFRVWECLSPHCSCSGGSACQGSSEVRVWAARRQPCAAAAVAAAA
eukprot:1153215-Pelagomonas_calceolata.AAC.9